MILTAIDAIAVDGLRHSPGQSLAQRRPELAALALAPFTDEPPPADVEAATLRPPLLAAEIEALLDAGGGGEELELLVREAVDLRDGPTLWQVIAVLQRRGAARPGAAPGRADRAGRARGRLVLRAAAGRAAARIRSRHSGAGGTHEEIFVSL